MSVETDSKRVENAVRKAKEKFAANAKNQDAAIVVCPQCRHGTLVTKTDRGDYCYYCHKEYKMARCTGCSGFVAEEETDEYGLCPTCCREGSVMIPR